LWGVLGALNVWCQPSLNYEHSIPYIQAFVPLNCNLTLSKIMRTGILS
jgi:hypothetical protein